MANWCNNRLIIDGSKQEVDKVLSFVKGGECDFDFQKIIPMPKELANTNVPTPKKEEALQVALNKKYGSPNWYEWCQTHWNTDWNAGNVVVFKGLGVPVEISFETAWTPPTNVIRVLGEKFPNIKFDLTYIEPAGEFAGCLKICEGQTVKEECYCLKENKANYTAILCEFEDENIVYDSNGCEKTSAIPEKEKPKTQSDPKTLKQLIAHPPKDLNEIKDPELKQKFFDYLLEENISTVDAYDNLKA
jgi:hypothetical protein